MDSNIIRILTIVIRKEISMIITNNYIETTINDNNNETKDSNSLQSYATNCNDVSNECRTVMF